MYCSSRILGEPYGLLVSLFSSLYWSLLWWFLFRLFDFCSEFTALVHLFCFYGWFIARRWDVDVVIFEAVYSGFRSPFKIRVVIEHCVWCRFFFYASNHVERMKVFRSPPRLLSPLYQGMLWLSVCFLAWDVEWLLCACGIDLPRRALCRLAETRNGCWRGIHWHRYALCRHATFATCMLTRWMSRRISTKTNLQGQNMKGDLMPWDGSGIGIGLPCLRLMMAL